MNRHEKLAERLEAAADAVSEAETLTGALADALEASLVDVEAASSKERLTEIARLLAGEAEGASNGLKEAYETIRSAGNALDAAIENTK
jgi:hypothetical protein